MLGIEHWKALVNMECLVIVGHQPTMNTSLPFVHTARRYYRSNDLVRRQE